MEEHRTVAAWNARAVAQSARATADVAPGVRAAAGAGGGAAAAAAVVVVVVVVVVVGQIGQRVVACGVFVDGDLRGVDGGLVDGIFDRVSDPPLPALHLTVRLGAPERGSVHFGATDDKRGWRRRRR